MTPHTNPTPAPRVPLSRDRVLDADDYPHFAEHAQQHLAESGRHDVGGFEFQLDLILDGLQRLREAGRAPA